MREVYESLPDSTDKELGEGILSTLRTWDNAAFQRLCEVRHILSKHYHSRMRFSGFTNLGRTRSSEAGSTRVGRLSKRFQKSSDLVPECHEKRIGNPANNGIQVALNRRQIRRSGA